MSQISVNETKSIGIDKKNEKCQKMGKKSKLSEYC